MSVEVVMPQMGESITEGTVSRWLKKPGDSVAKDEPILEISTDKVDAEVPSPAAGVLSEIRTAEGETVAVGTVVALIGDSVSTSAPAPEKTKEETPAPTAETSSASTDVVMPQMGESITEGTVSKWLKKVGDAVAKDEPLLEISTDKVDAEVPSPGAGTLIEIRVQEGETVAVGSTVAVVGTSGAATKGSSKPVDRPMITEQKTSAVPSPTLPSVPMPVKVSNGNSSADIDSLRRSKSSPLVRNIAKEHGIDINRIPGSGLSGRVTKKDIMTFIETGAALRPQDLLPKSKSSLSFAAPAAIEGDRVEPMSVMRKKIAEHMTHSKQTSAHVTSVYEIDMTRVAKFRSQHQAAFQAQHGTKLTFMPFIFEAVTRGLRHFPIINSQVQGDKIVFKGDVNIGMAVALDWGLIVPVIKQADKLSLSALAKTANDLADRSRTKKLSPADVQDGTFTITNPGVFGGLYGTPIINQPQVAIMCIGTIEKRPKVLTLSNGEDVIAIRTIIELSMAPMPRNPYLL